VETEIANLLLCVTVNAFQKY